MTTPETITLIPLEQLHESPFNPRKTYTGLDELAASIRAEGVLQPIVVRPRFTNPLRDDVIDGYEVVFGHRRLRATELAGLAAIPCIVRPMSHLEARRAQLTENIQRADVHPIEEAEAFAELIEQHGVTAEQLAEQIGKSVSHVYARLTLRRLLPSIRDRVLAGEVDAETALLLARLRVPKLQEQALNHLRNHNVSIEDGGRISYRKAREILRERYTLELKGAIFDADDATLLPEAGTCAACPKRTGNAPEFADLLDAQNEGWRKSKGNPQLCTDPDCFDQKKKAHLKRAADALAAKGEAVIDGNKARQAIGADGKVKGGYIALADVRGELKKAADKGKVATVTIQDPRTGKLVKAVKADDAKAAGVKVPEPKKQSGSRYDWQAEQEARQARAQAENARRLALLQALQLGMAANPRDSFDLRLLLDFALDASPSLDFVAQVYGFKLGDNAEAAVKAWAAQRSRDEVAVLLLIIAASHRGHSHGFDNDEEPELLYAAARHYGLDPEAPLDQLQQLAQTSAPAAEEPEEALA